MTEQEKAALIERCKTISTWRDKYGDSANVMLPAAEAEKIATITLASLTAEHRHMRVFGDYGDGDVCWVECDADEEGSFHAMCAAAPTR